MDIDLIRLVLTGRASPDVESAVDRWRREDPANEARFQEIRRILALAREAESGRAPGPPPAARDIVEAAGESFKLESEPDEDPKKPRTSRWKRDWMVPAAAAAVLVLTGVGLFQLRSSEDRLGTDSFANTSFVTSGGEAGTVRFGDGSIIRLAPESRLRVAPDPAERKVMLDGEAFFAVAEDAGRPFVVETATGRVRVLGTRFGLRTATEEAHLVVVEGTVSFETSAGSTEVGKGEVSRARRGEQPTVEATEDVASHLQWMGTSLAFQTTPLVDVAEELEARFGYSVEIEADGYEDATVTAWLDEESPAEVMRVVCRVINAPCTINERETRVGESERDRSNR